MKTKNIKEIVCLVNGFLNPQMGTHAAEIFVSWCALLLALLALDKCFCQAGFAV